MEKKVIKARIIIVVDDESSHRILSIILGKNRDGAQAVVTGCKALVSGLAECS